MTPRTLSFSRLSGLGPLPKLFEAEEGRPALQRLLASEDVRLDGLPPSTPIPFPNLNEVFNRATRLSGDILFPLRVALSMRPEDYGPLVIYALGAATLEAGIKRLNRFAALQSSASILVLRDARGEAAWSLEYIRARGLRVDRHALHVLAPMIAFIRRYAGASAEPIQLELPSGADTGHGAIGEALGVPVRAAADVFRVVFPSEWLNRQRPRARSEQILSYLDMMAYYRGDVLPRTMTDTVAALLAPVIGADRARSRRRRWKAEGQPPELAAAPQCRGNEFPRHQPRRADPAGAAPDSRQSRADGPGRLGGGLFRSGPFYPRLQDADRIDP